MDKLRQVYCRYDMVCDAPKGSGVEIIPMPEFFSDKPDIETKQTHIHDFYEIVWFSEGSGTHYVDFNAYPVQKNSIFFISSGQMHSFDRTDTQKGYVIKICSKLLSDQGDEDISYLKYNVFNTDSAPCYRIKDEFADKLQKIIDDLRGESVNDSAICQEDYLRALVRILIITIERGCEQKESRVMSVTKTSHRTFLEFRRLIEKNFADRHTVKDYAGLIGVSTKTLTNYVSECSPLSPLEMINNRIALEAKRLLRYSNLMIKEIAYRLGFEDPSYFIKFFKRIVGVSPLEFRDQDSSSPAAEV